ncbi:DNA-directed RNA polymerase subunit alpha [Candidatus Jorgensenbacteria bacterium GWA1_54_12]|uniref:DNA-directed RNA polymerase subunit alpha n=1 Tax=Candidatus Jorgensenbacteria bacterium GWA1_54_12 TaxID=1798468 RepID=A0A1F6BL61_9BACT|nr:MAG: DNA-directed RNA polymerase subunit alpha [Candidatus Jorgensenbacteria bacterium GWA1_54_12]
MEYSYVSGAVTVKTVKETKTEGEFHLEGLYPGYGATVGNALRRTLLSSLPGAAISQVKVKGVKHEFSTIPGVMEDVVAVMLNLKQVRFEFHADEPQVLELKVKGKREVTAGDIKDTAFVSVVNKDIHLANITDGKTELEMELTVEKGLGYVSAEARRAERLAVGTILLDCVFSPVRSVRMNIENMRVGEHTDYNRLKFVITTDGSITPSRALRQATHILRDHFDKVSQSLPEDPSASSEQKDSAGSPQAGFVCDECGFTAKSERGLRTHKSKQHS